MLNEIQFNKCLGARRITENHLFNNEGSQSPLLKRLVRKAYIRQPVFELARAVCPKVSIIIPCYNYGHFLPDSIGSALAQEGIQSEVIVIDDASTDDSAAVAQRFADGDARVILLRHKQNSGQVIAFNDGYALATGEFIVRLDADDMLTPGSLARAVALFDAFPSVGLVYGHPRHFTTEIPPEPQVGKSAQLEYLGRCGLARRKVLEAWNVITSPEVVIRASVMKPVGPLSPRLKFGMDMEMWLRIAAVSDVGRVDGPGPGAAPRSSG